MDGRLGDVLSSGIQFEACTSGDRVGEAEECSTLSWGKMVSGWRNVGARNGRSGEGRAVGNKKRWPARPSFFALLTEACALFGLATPVAMRLVSFVGTAAPLADLSTPCYLLACLIRVA